MNFEHPVAIKIRKQITQAIVNFKMLGEGDKLLVCVSGGKDSSVLLSLLNEIQKKAPYNFQLEAAILDQGQPGFDPSQFKIWVESQGIKLHVLTKDTYSIVKEKVTDGVYCSLCSRLRRGILYTFAHQNKFTKLALGHHRDDLNQTLLMNLFFTGKMASMPPKLKSDDGKNILIRPLCYTAEKDIEILAKDWNFPILPCNLCGSQDGMQRKKIKALINNLEKDIPEIQNSMLAALGNIHVSQLLDQKLWDHSGLQKDENLTSTFSLQ